MKNLLAFIIVFISFSSSALERKDISDVSMKAILSDTQSQPDNVSDKHLSLVWWVPYEYWASALSRNPNIKEQSRKEILDVLQNYLLIAIVQAEISPVGIFDYYPRKEIEESLVVIYKNHTGKTEKLSLLENISEDMTALLVQITPVLKAAMGNLGENFQFFVYSDRNEGGDRKIDPYQQGVVRVEFDSRKKEKLDVSFNTPLNSLYIPRVCPNGELAHVSWEYCPWSGKKLL